MPQVEFTKANDKDFFDVVDFLDFVFSFAYQPQDFEAWLPGLYSPENFMSGTNYIVKEDGKIVANVGSYPAVYHVCGERLKVAGITSVGVHPRARSKGYMRALMDMALVDMRKDGTALSFLIGQRQRYEYFGYTPCGVRLKFYVRTVNIQHHFHKALHSDVMLKEIHAGNTAAFDALYHMYNAEKAHVERPRGRFMNTMATWESKTIGIYKNDALIGYLSAAKDYGAIGELSISDMSLLGEVMGVYLNQYRRHDVTIEAYPPETTLITYLSGLAESASAVHANNFNVLDYPAVLNAFLKLKSSYTVLPDGALTIRIRDIGNITVTVAGNRPSVSITKKTPDAECSHLEAMRLFFSPVSAYALGPLEGNAFARSLLPIPLYVRKNDQS